MALSKKSNEFEKFKVTLNLQPLKINNNKGLKSPRVLEELPKTQKKRNKSQRAKKRYKGEEMSEFSLEFNKSLESKYAIIDHSLNNPLKIKEQERAELQILKSNLALQLASQSFKNQRNSTGTQKVEELAIKQIQLVDKYQTNTKAVESGPQQLFKGKSFFVRFKSVTHL